MKKMSVVFNAFKSSVLCFVLFMSACLIGFTSCGDDDDPQGGGTVEIGVPPSVVDGVRASEVQGIKIVYNEDGTVNHATTEDGTEYKFNYASTRAATRPLTNITATRSVGGESETWEAREFTTSPAGFITGYRLEYSYKADESWEKSSILYRITYGSNNCISKVDMSGTWQDQEEQSSDSGAYNYAYGQNGELVEISATNGSSVFFRQKFQYEESLNNKFNIMLATLMPEDLISDDNIFVILGVSGYLGNTSAQLPTYVTLNYLDPEYPEDNSTDHWDISYSLGANEVIYSYNVNEMVYPCKFIGTDIDVDVH